MKPLRGRSLPDIVLVRKTYPNRKDRAWKLKSLPNKQVYPLHPPSTLIQ
jgi:hypothetical protein